MTRNQNVISWILQLLAAVILFQTLFFKFTGAEESIYIFTKLGMEPWGRIGSGVAELIACVLLVRSRTAVWGALLALGVISGAIVSHLTRLGIVVQGDGGLLFLLAVTVFVASGSVLVLRRCELPVIGGGSNRRWAQPRNQATAHSPIGEQHADEGPLRRMPVE